MPVKIFATGTRRRREKCHQSERMFRPAGSQAHALPGSRSCWSIHLVDHSRCVCVGQRKERSLDCTPSPPGRHQQGRCGCSRDRGRAPLLGRLLIIVACGWAEYADSPASLPVSSPGGLGPVWNAWYEREHMLGRDRIRLAIEARQRPFISPQSKPKFDHCRWSIKIRKRQVGCIVS